MGCRTDRWYKSKETSTVQYVTVRFDRARTKSPAENLEM